MRRRRTRCGGSRRSSDSDSEMRRALIASIAIWPCLLVAQQPSPAPSQQATFRTSTLLIVQTVTVKDKNGKPVPGLTARDFVVTEDGVPQDIAFVEYQKLDAPPLGTTVLGPDATRAAAPAPAAAPLAPVTAVGESLNAVPLPGDTRYRGKRLIVLYLDLSAMGFFDQYRVFDAVRTYFDTMMTAADMV